MSTSEKMVTILRAIENAIVNNRNIKVIELIEEYCAIGQGKWVFPMELTGEYNETKITDYLLKGEFNQRLIRKFNCGYSVSYQNMNPDFILIKVDNGGKVYHIGKQNQGSTDLKELFN